MTAVKKEDTFEMEDFAALFEESLENQDVQEGAVTKGTIVGLEKDLAIIDVGLKSEGRIPVKEFSIAGQPAELKIGDEVVVYIERVENRNGEAVLSREKALREEAWEKLEVICEKGEEVKGTIFGRVKGGFTVDVQGAIAFLPGSQVDIRPIRDITPLMNIEQPFQILKMDRKRGNIVVSRRAIMEESRAGQRDELLANIKEGAQLEGIVKNITDYGAFIDLGGVDGLLHVTDISWKRINHPSEVFAVGDTINVMVTKYDQETKRVSLGMKQLEANPWEAAEGSYAVGAKFKGRVSNVTDYGAFVELENGIEGLVHVSEMSWTKKNTHPSKIVAVGQEVDIQILEVDTNKHRISLGMKQCEENPWQQFAQTHKEGIEIEGEIRNITEFGLFVGLEGGIDGLVHHSDISWDEAGETAIAAFEKGAKIKAKILLLDVDKERVSLGIKQLTENPNKEAVSGMKKGATVTCTVQHTSKDGVEVIAEGGAKGFIKKVDVAKERKEQRPERFAEGDRIDAKILSVAKTGVLNLSIKALEIDQHNQAIAEYGSTDSGASLGDILGAALNEAGKKD